MCIACRKRQEQNLLIRLQCKDKVLQNYDGVGRSFYICSECLNDNKKLEKILFRECKNKGDYLSQLKEIVGNVR
jgi:predicted RNA-binding protein YlxR (DUF448 family)